MRRRLNWKAVIILSALLALVLPGGFFLQRYQVRANSRAFLDQADRASQAREALSQGQGEVPEGEVVKLLNKEIDYLRRYLGFKPKDGDEVLERYGLLMADERIATTPMGRFRALTVLEQVLGRTEGKASLRRKVVDLGMSVGRFSDAADHLNKLLPGKDKPDGPVADDPELRTLRGICYQELRQLSAARADYEVAIGLPGASAEPYARLAYLLRNEKMALISMRGEKVAELEDQADHVIDQMVVNRPDDYRARLARAEYMRTFGMKAGAATVYDAAQVDVDEAVRLGKDQPEVLFALAELALQRRAPDQARGYLVQGITKHPKNARLYLALVNVEQTAGRLTEAAKVARQGLEKLPTNLDLLWVLADALVESKSAEADGVIKRLELAGLGPAEVGVLRGRQLAKKEDRAEAMKALAVAFEGLRGQLARGRNAFQVDLARQAGMLLGQLNERSGNYDAASAAYKQVLEVDGRSLLALAGLAQALRKAGRFPESLEAYTELASRGGPSSAIVERARLKLLVNARRPDPNWAEVEQAISAAEEKVRPLPVDVVLFRLEMLARQAGRLREAEAYLDWLLVSYLTTPVRIGALVTTPATAIEPLPLFFYVAKAYLFDAAGGPEAAASARQALIEAGRAHGPSTALTEAWVRHWASVDDPEAAKKGLAEIEREVVRTTGADKQPLLMSLATAYQRKGDREGARRAWAEVAKENVEDIPSRVGLVEVAASAGDEKGLDEQIQALKKIEGEAGAQWRYATVRQLLRKATRDEKARESLLAEADAQLKVIKARRPDWSRATLAEAQVADLRNDRKLALDKYLQAIGQGERGPATIQRAVLLSFQQRRSQAERANLFSRLTDVYRTGLLNTIMAEDAIAGGDIATAVKLATDNVTDAEKKLNNNETDKELRTSAVMSNWFLGQVLQVKAKVAKSEGERKEALDKAEAAYRRAADLDQKSVLAQSGLTLFLASVKPEQAKAELTKLKALTTDAAVLAPCLEALGQVEEAERAYAKLVATSPREAGPLAALTRFYLRQGQAVKALPHMKTLVDKFPTSQEAKELKPLRALMEVRTSTYKEAQDKLQALGSPDGLRDLNSPTAVGEQRGRAAILSMLPGRENREQAIKLLMDLVLKKKHQPSDHLTLARLYERQGNWNNARLHLLALEETGGANAAAALVPLVRGLLRHDPAEARRAVERLEKADPRSFVTAELKARVLHLENKTDEAVKLLTGALRGRETLANLQMAAAALETMGRKADAEKLYQRVVAAGKNSPRALEALVSFYGRQKEAKKALDLCDKVWASTPESAAELSLIVLAAMPRDDEVLRRLEAQFTRAQAAAPQDPRLASALGHLRVMQGRNGDAEALYRAALEADPKNVITKNNLAWLLGLQKDRAAEALKLTEQVINQVGPRPWVLDTQGVALLTMGQTKEALALLKESTMEDPTPTANFHHAWALSQDKQTALAKARLQEAVKAGLKDTDLHPMERPVLARLCQELNVTLPSQ